MIFRFPDKPTRSTREAVARFRPEEYIAQAKYDGWRVQIHFDDTFQIFSSSGAHTTPVSAGALLPEAMAVSPSLKFPKDIITDISHIKGIRFPAVLDAEFVGPRGDMDPGIFVFDCLAWNGKWLTKVPYEQRWDICQGLDMKGTVQLVRCLDGDFLAEFDKLKAEWLQSGGGISLYEGLVLKYKRGSLQLDRSSSKKSNAMFKLRFRDIDAETEY